MAKATRAMVLGTALLTGTLLLPCALAPQAQAAVSPDVKIVSSAGKWSTSHSTAKYKVKGKAVKGLVGIGGKTYYFDSKGVQRTGWRCVYGIYYHFAPSSKEAAHATTSKVVNGVKLNKYGQAMLTNKNVIAELETMARAQKLLDKVSKPLQSKSAKLRASFNYIKSPKNIDVRVLHGWTTRNGWWRLFANDIFVKKAGDCNSMGFAMAYMGNAIGCKKNECVSSGGHSWARINGLIYDPQQGNYGVGGVYGGVHYAGAGIYHVSLNRTSVWPGKRIANAGVSTRKGLVKRNGSLHCYDSKGRMVTSKWVTVKGKRYYFTSTGKAACNGSVKIKGVYYVFNKGGALQKGKGTRVVKIGSVKYQVSKAGKAKSGWNAKKTMCFKKNGAMCTGIELLSEKLTAFSSSGVYNASLTAQLRAAAGNIFDAQTLVALMGKPKSTITEASCAGTDGPDGQFYDFEDVTIKVYKYAHVSIQTACFTLRDGTPCEKLTGVSAR